MPSDTSQQKRILSELQGLTSHTLSVDSNEYVVIDIPASATSTTPKGDKLIERMVNGDTNMAGDITENDLRVEQILNERGVY